MTTAKRSQIMSIIQAYSGQQNVIPIPRIYVEMTGDYAAAALLNQILYWSERTNDTDGWFYKSYADWQEELCLSQYQVNRIIDGDKRSQKKTIRLRDLGVETMLKKSKKGAPTVHYRLDESVFVNALTKHLDSKKTSIINNVDNPIINIVNNPLSTLSIMDNEQCSQSLRTEITTENTAEITTEKKEPTLAPMAHPDKTTSPFADTSYKGLYAVIAKYSFKFQEGEKIPKSSATRIGGVVKGVMELEPTPTVAELIRVYRYDRDVHSDISVPNQAATIINIVKEFRQASDYKQYLSDRDRVLSSLDTVSSAPAPTAAAIDAALYHNPPQAVIDAAPEYPMSPEEQIAWDEAQAKILAMINRGKKQPPRMPPQPQKAG
jgi:hypothetical protein